MRSPSRKSSSSSHHHKKIKRERSRSASSSGSDTRTKHNRRSDKDRDESRRRERNRDEYRSRPVRDDRRDRTEGSDSRRGRGRGGFRGGRGGFQGRKRHGAEEDNFEWGKSAHREEKPKEQVDKEQPNFGLSGKLTEATNMVNGVVVKYSEPPEARKSTRRWRFYVFKGDETLPTLYIHRQSAYLIGKDRRVADIRLDHPSISAQHAALQYRLVSIKSEDGVKSFKAIRPYIIDLESSNGTFLNNKKIDPKRYVELKEKDVLKFGFSSREYVVLHEHSQGDEESGDEIVDDGPNA
ncbi:smad nuclear interacting protein 1 isoform X2 [Neocloeon triangulifer]|uniref:smad nuclear interacting protein 1 isoform X2 n=1 Tax=Neocloeon triangulifer TaxID=2078957 RepID=UPI00286ED470|nr:smad nuclear interacting protein 1 isoform X2 [Neocloeon triangulifer]